MLRRSHSRVILILAVRLLPKLHTHSLSPLKRDTDNCRGIAAHIARPLVVPTQEAYWYLPWDCYLHCMPTRCAHSRGILILAVRLQPTLHAHSLRPLKRHTDTCCGTATGPFSRPTLRPTQVAPLSVAWNFSQTFPFVVIVTCSGLKPTCAHSRDNAVKLSWASHHYCLFWIYRINIYVFVISYNITPDHKYCSLIHHLVATHNVCHILSAGKSHFFRRVVFIATYYIKINNYTSRSNRRHKYVDIALISK